jgi:ribosomal protein S6--L-glutamate ligase
VGGVDIIRSNRGPLIIEINVAPDFGGEFGLEKTAGVDVASEIIKFAVEGKKKFTRNSNRFFNLRRWRTDAIYPQSLLPQNRQ